MRILAALCPGMRIFFIVTLETIVVERFLSSLYSSEDEYFFETVGSPYHMAPEVLNDKPYNMKVS